MSVIVKGMEMPEYCGECDFEPCTKWKNHKPMTRPDDCSLRPLLSCGDCRWFTDTGYPNLDPEMPELRMGHCRILGRDVQACWFCGAGEQEEDEDG